MKYRILIEDENGKMCDYVDIDTCGRDLEPESVMADICENVCSADEVYEACDGCGVMMPSDELVDVRSKSGDFNMRLCRDCAE